MLNIPPLVNDLTALLTALFITAAATPLVRKIALRWKLGDKPNGRKIHPHLIPHVGGIAIVLGTLVGVFAASATGPERDSASSENPGVDGSWFSTKST